MNCSHANLSPHFSPLKDNCEFCGLLLLQSLPPDLWPSGLTSLCFGTSPVHFRSGAAEWFPEGDRWWFVCILKVGSRQERRAWLTVLRSAEKQPVWMFGGSHDGHERQFNTLKSKTQTYMMFLRLNGRIVFLCVCVVGIKIITAVCEHCIYVLVQLALSRN